MFWSSQWLLTVLGLSTFVVAFAVEWLLALAWISTVVPVVGLISHGESSTSAARKCDWACLCPFIAVPQHMVVFYRLWRARQASVRTREGSYQC